MFQLKTPGIVALDELEREYLVKRELGQGGMGVVYLARHRTSHHEVAIKVIDPRLVADPESLRRVEREAALSARVRHRNIVQHYETRRLKNGGVALVRQYVPGETLASLLKRTPRLSFEAASAVLTDVLSGLAAVHEIGVVHRDVKPGNIFLEARTGRAMLSDFGIARALQGSVDVTQAGSTIGTPMYMAPEQLERGDVDARADLYSAGLLGWEMLSGRRPWDGDSLFVLMQRKKAGDLPPVTVFRADTPHRFELALEGALATRPSHRWRGAREFLDQLQSEEPTERAIARREHVARSLQRAAKRALRAVPDGATIPLSREVREQSEREAVEHTAALTVDVDEHEAAPRARSIRSARWRAVALVGAGAIAGGALVAFLARDTPRAVSTATAGTAPSAPVTVSASATPPAAQREAARAATSPPKQLETASATTASPTQRETASATGAPEAREPSILPAGRFDADDYRRRTHDDLARGDLRSAWGHAEVLARLGRPLEAEALMATIEARSLEPRRARERLETMMRTRVSPRRAFTPIEAVEVASAWMAVGDSAAALDALERARPRTVELSRLLDDPALRRLRGSPRWNALVMGVGTGR
jgi:hypothetical protein